MRHNRHITRRHICGGKTRPQCRVDIGTTQTGGGVVVVEVGEGGRLPRLGSRCVTTPVKRGNRVLVVRVPNSSSGTQATVALAAAAARHYVNPTHTQGALIL